MAKILAFSLACFLALLTIAGAFRTTITTTVMEDARLQDCGQQYQQQQHLNRCKMYLSEGKWCQEPEPKRQEEYLVNCCMQLGEISERCRCLSLRQSVEELKQQEGIIRYEPGQVQEMLDKAQSLPGRCRIEPQQCQFGAVFSEF